eukprot:scpid80675/ scgid16050/ 
MMTWRNLLGKTMSGKTTDERQESETQNALSLLSTLVETVKALTKQVEELKSVIVIQAEGKNSAFAALQEKVCTLESRNQKLFSVQIVYRSDLRTQLSQQHVSNTHRTGTHSNSQQTARSHPPRTTTLKGLWLLRDQPRKMKKDQQTPTGSRQSNVTPSALESVENQQRELSHLSMRSHAKHHDVGYHVQFRQAKTQSILPWECKPRMPCPIHSNLVHRARSGDVQMQCGRIQSV